MRNLPLSGFGGLQGQVLCLAAAEGLLFSGGQDKTIKVWKFDNDSQTFHPLVCPRLFPLGGALTILLFSMIACLLVVVTECCACWGALYCLVGP